MTTNKYIISALFMLALFSCKKDTITCDGSTPNYNNEIKQIMDNSCISCHGTNSGNGDMSTYAKLKVYVSNGSFEREVLTKRTMPQNGTLSDAQLTKIKCWLENGAVEN